MLGCSNLKVPNVDDNDINQTEVRKIINKINNKNNNEKLNFLILLNEQDYKKYLYIFPSRKDRLNNQKYNFPGNLIIEKYENIDILNYKIEDNPIQNQLYIMLPKEKIFINSENFTSRLIDSKLEELKDIFVLLKAKSIKINKNFKTLSKENININNTANINNINIEQEINLENIENNNNNTSNEMTFLHNSNEINLNNLYNNDYYFLNKQHDWQNIIIRRIEGNLSKDKYIYHNKEIKIFKTKFVNKLKFLKLSIDYDWEKLKDLKIEYEIEYLPLDDQLYSNKLKNDFINVSTIDEVNNYFISIATINEINELNNDFISISTIDE